jgi:hypothetical protein|tara:strand:- start:224 stop:667 length:444 start_codon:yes stop_codon:yes gene_type:complete
MTIKTFRGLLNDGAQERIRLETIDGKRGYRVKKFEVITTSPGTTADESVLKIYKIKQTTIDGIIDFSDQIMIGVGYWSAATSSGSPATMNIVIENEIFNQDIYITHKNNSTASSVACNYYLELELISLDDVEATAAILKSFRNTNTV